MKANIIDYEQLRKALKDWWEVEQKDFDELMETRADGNLVSVLAPNIEIDSLRAVRALIELEALVGFDIPPRVVRLGGYLSFEDMEGHLILELKKLEEKKRGNVNA